MIDKPVCIRTCNLLFIKDLILLLLVVVGIYHEVEGEFRE